MNVNSLPWYYVHSPLWPDHQIRLEEEEWRHCHQVLRMREGERLILFNGAGTCLEGMILAAHKSHGMISLTHDRSENFAFSRPYRLVMAFAPTKNTDRTEFAIEKLTELGVDEICLLDCRHGERSHIRRDRLEKIILSACKQSRKLYLPYLRDLTPPGALIREYQQKPESWEILGCHHDTTATFAGDTVQAGCNVMMMVGPEGGFSAEEANLFQELGVKTVTLGPHRLRVETAAIAACVIAHTVHTIRSL